LAGGIAGLPWAAMTAGGIGQPGIGQPMTYELDGRQYVTVMAGRGGTEPSRVWTFALE
jgi:hypothetical protein